MFSSVFKYSLTRHDGSSSWTTVPAVLLSVSGKKRFFRRFRFLVPVRFLSHPGSFFPFADVPFSFPRFPRPAWKVAILEISGSVAIPPPHCAPGYNYTLAPAYFMYSRKISLFPPHKAQSHLIGFARSEGGSLELQPAGLLRVSKQPKCPNVLLSQERKRHININKFFR